MKELVGSRIMFLSVNEDQNLLRFQTNRGSIVYEAFGDCCSESWFADITGVLALLNQNVLSVEEVEMECVQDDRSRQEHDSLYGVKIKTTGGYVDVVFRNSSNGYYGGWIALKEDPDSWAHYVVWTDIKDDWSA